MYIDIKYKLTIKKLTATLHLNNKIIIKQKTLC